MLLASQKPSMFAYFKHLHKNSCKVLMVQLIFNFFKIKLENFYTDDRKFYYVTLDCVKVI